MITGEIKNKVDKIWSDIWSGGVTNPITVIEQLTYLIFIRSLDEKDIAIEEVEALSSEVLPKIFPPDKQHLRYSKFKFLDTREMYDIVANEVFPFIKELGDNIGDIGETEDVSFFSRYMKDATFMFPEGKKQLLQKVITSLDDIFDTDLKERDMLGDLYEYMLSKLSTAGQNGQFRTPKHIRDLMVNLIAPKPMERICDPACGTSGFLVSSAEYIRNNHEKNMLTEEWEDFNSSAFSGFDSDHTMLRISAMNLMLHSIANPYIDYKDSISKQNYMNSIYDVVLTNPPFKGSVDTETINDNLKTICDTKKTELLFLSLFVRMLKVGGRCACIVPDGVLFGSSKAHISIRKNLVEQQQLQAIISMPSGVFKPYAGVSTAILIFTKTGIGGTDKVWFYNMQADGYSLDDNRTEVTENDKANVNGHVYFVRLKNIVNNKFILNILFSPEYRDYIRSVCVGGIDKRQLNKNHIEDFLIIFPPLDLQNKFAEIEEQKTQVNSALNEATDLCNALMQQFFD